MTEEKLTEEETKLSDETLADEADVVAPEADVVASEADVVAPEADNAKETVEEAAAEEAPLTLEEQLAAAQAEAAKNLDGWMRAQAEFANARKRMEKQRAETYLNATAEVVTRLLPAVDDFGRAMSDIPEEIAGHSWLEGIVLVQRKLGMILESLSVKPIDAVGQPFDPMYHEAIMQEPSDEHESGVVTKELQQGYQLGDRVIRPTLVYVAE